jgi:hypothetical protein
MPKGELSIERFERISDTIWPETDIEAKMRSRSNSTLPDGGSACRRRSGRASSSSCAAFAAVRGPVSSQPVDTVRSGCGVGSVNGQSPEGVEV